MIRRLQIYEGKSYDPYYNLAVEQRLMETVADDCCILYLWQNENTVVIGRNQNAWKECRVSLLEKEGVRLARRLSGGGAVYHDLGNLNFTFLVSTANYDLARQLSVIVQACQNFGISAEVSGRNDVLADGRKVSGNAFYKNGPHSYHHGTLLVDVDMDRLTRYLNPSKAKLQAKGVDSVRSRVINLRELCGKITIEGLKKELIAAFQKVYALEVEPLVLSQEDEASIETLRIRNESPQWNLGETKPFTMTAEKRFNWGELQLMLRLEGGLVTELKAYSDAMDWQIVQQLEAVLGGQRLAPQALRARIVSALPEVGQEIAELLTEQGF